MISLFSSLHHGLRLQKKAPAKAVVAGMSLVGGTVALSTSRGAVGAKLGKIVLSAGTFVSKHIVKFAGIGLALWGALSLARIVIGVAGKFSDKNEEKSTGNNPAISAAG